MFPFNSLMFPFNSLMFSVNWVCKVPSPLEIWMDRPFNSDPTEGSPSDELATPDISQSSWPSRWTTQRSEKARNLERRSAKFRAGNAEQWRSRKN